MAELKWYLLYQHEEYSHFLPFSVSSTELPFSSPESSRDCTATIRNEYFLLNVLTCDPSSVITNCAAWVSFKVSRLCHIAEGSAGTESKYPE